MANAELEDDEPNVILEVTEFEAQLMLRALKDARNRLEAFAEDAEKLGDMAKSMIDVAQGEVEVIDDLLTRFSEE